MDPFQGVVSLPLVVPLEMCPSHVTCYVWRLGRRQTSVSQEEVMAMFSYGKIPPFKNLWRHMKAHSLPCILWTRLDCHVYRSILWNSVYFVLVQRYRKCWVQIKQWIYFVFKGGRGLLILLKTIEAAVQIDTFPFGVLLCTCTLYQ